jgi:hypothetical protein
MGGAKTVDARKYIQKPDDTSMLAMLSAQQGIGQQYLQNQAQLLQEYSRMPPAMQTFDAGRVSREAAEFGIENKLRSREFEKLTDPYAARMRQEMGSRVAELTDIAATQQGMDALAKSQGLTSGYSSGLGGTIGRSGMYDASTEAGRLARLGNLGIQQSYLAQTQAPVGGLDPATAIQAEMAAKAANLQAMQKYQQNVMAGGQGLQQSTSDWINRNLGQLSQANQVSQQNKQNYEQAMLSNAIQNQQSQNALMGSILGTGGAIAGTGIGFMVGGPIGAGIGGSLGSQLGSSAASI